MVFRLFFFENNQLNLAVYFLITSIVLYFGPENFIPNLYGRPDPPIVDAPCATIIGTHSMTRYGRDIAAFRGVNKYVFIPGFVPILFTNCHTGHSNIFLLLICRHSFCQTTCG